ncbi:glycosyl hydrolase-related protein, partial [Fischerella thermalis]
NPPLSMNGDGLEASFLDLSAENLILMSLKQAEDDPHKWILRFYECHGETADLSLQNNLGLSLEESVDLLERPFSTSEFSSTAIDQKLTIKPWKIINLKLQVSDSATA